MRTLEQISKIQSTIEDPRSIQSFLSVEQLSHLIEIFNRDSSKSGPYTNVVYKNTGPITLDLQHYYNDSIISDILNRLKLIIGNYKITAAFFFKTDYPHIIHNDDTFELPDSVYKAITLPLKLENFSDRYPKLCFFNQFYFHGPAKFFNRSDNVPTYYNKQIYEYSQVTGIVEDKIIDNNNYFTHLKPQWLEGLSLHSSIDWIPGNAIVFDSVRLHCSSDFRNLGIKAKLGISIFTKKL